MAKIRLHVVFLALATLTAAAGATTTVFQTNLVTDDQAANTAQITDSQLLNPWGVSYSSTGPFWVSDNAAGVATLYTVDPATHATSKNSLVVTIPGSGAVTGQAFNPGFGSGAFGGNLFLFVSEDGTISGWSSGTSAINLQLPAVNTVYKGAALVTNSGHSYLLSANFANGTIDVLKGDGLAPSLTGNFTDPVLPSGYAPFNIALLNGKLYVSYALQDAAKTDDVPGAGHGFVSVFDTQGAFLGRVASQGALNSPWGLAIAPPAFGDVAGDLLVANFGDGTINVYNPDPATPGFISTLNGPNNQPLTIDGLWSLIPGNNGNAGSASEIFFTAGPNGESDGLFGVLAIPEPATLSLMAFSLTPLLLRRRRR
jgi:uncharacterized protein (TIGR03118 family)